MNSIVTPGTPIAGGKSQQFAIANIDTIFKFYKPKPPLSNFVDSFGYTKAMQRRARPQAFFRPEHSNLQLTSAKTGCYFTTTKALKTATAFPAPSFQVRIGAASHPIPQKTCPLLEFTSNRAVLFHFSEYQRAISPILTPIWKHFGDRRPAGCASAFVWQELLASGFSCSRRLY